MEEGGEKKPGKVDLGSKQQKYQEEEGRREERRETQAPQGSGQA